MKKNLLKLVNLFALTSFLVWSGFACAQDVSFDEQKKRLIEQKIKLVEMLINSPAAKSTAYGRDAETPNLLIQSQEAINKARVALVENRYDEAKNLLDQALKTVSSASRRVSAGSPLSFSAQKKNLQDLAEQVATYRIALDELTHTPKSASEAKKLLLNLDSLSQESVRLEAGGDMGEASKKMASAYKLAVEGIAKLREGQEVVMSLKFDSPLDEYVYEQKRLTSNEIMVDMLISEGKAEGQKRLLVDSYINESKRLKREAEIAAEATKHKEAVALMEKATGQLVRALQTMGVAVF